MTGLGETYVQQLQTDPCRSSKIGNVELKLTWRRHLTFVTVTRLDLYYSRCSVCTLIILLSYYDKVNLLYSNVTPKMANYISYYSGLNVVQHIKPTCRTELKEASSELPLDWKANC